MYYLDENGQVKEIEEESLMIDHSSQFTEIQEKFGTGIYQPGLIVFTPGYEEIRQLKIDGTYKIIAGGNNNG